MSKSDDATVKQKQRKFQIAEPHNLSPRSKWLRDYYFKGVEREWNNEFMPFQLEQTGISFGTNLITI